MRLQAIGDYPGHVNITSLFNYTMRKVWLQQTRIGLSLYDFTGQGYLRESVSYIMKNDHYSLLNFHLYISQHMHPGSGILYCRADTNITAIRRPRKVISFVLCMYSCEEVLLLFRRNANGPNSNTRCAYM